jgi:hypothetical protein
MMEELQYPISRFEFNERYVTNNRIILTDQLASFPWRLAEIVATIPSIDYAKTYRPDGWTIRQLVHHLADSHTNMLMRVKSAIAQDKSKVMGYDEAAWAKFTDNDLPLEISLNMIAGIHAKVAHLYKNLTDDELSLSYFHSSEDRLFTLSEVLGMYVWHGNHHLEHIRIAASS